ncbi:hypothetical protein WJX73_002868 [Symbiochloris irregularis]|uniref:non-specific serine/threonine protein kinase n=1 Tax=Symbiochloris irregularis TaxID=706552 RepID=A0AAW1NJB9_9CHLO
MQSNSEAALPAQRSTPEVGLEDLRQGEDRDGDEDDDEVVEQDPSKQFTRYHTQVGVGRFKRVYKGFDEKRGIDVAWSKILQSSLHLDDGQMQNIVAEMATGLGLDHPNIIRCYRTWQDEEKQCINLITEFFTSGNLREYRQRHKHLELKAVRKWARQLLSGLEYLHGKAPPIVHGDLRCDKVYINGHSGEIKIGDLGLATLLPRRFDPAVLPNGLGRGGQYTKQVDIFAFGLVILELATKRKLDAANCPAWPELLDTLQDPDFRSFIKRCLMPDGERPTASELLDDAFFTRKVVRENSGKATASLQAASLLPPKGVNGPAAALTPRASEADDTSVTTCEVGTVRGEDYNFQFSGKIRDNKLHFRLQMQYEGDEDLDKVGHKRTIDFFYDADVDTPEEIASEISNEFALSSTDRDICAAALKEWLAKEAPNSSG